MSLKEGGDGFVRADQIDLKSLDEQLEKHLNRVWTIDNNTNTKKDVDHVDADNGKLRHTNSSSNLTATTFVKKERLEWEIDPSKLIIKTVIARVKLLDWGEEGHRTDADFGVARVEASNPNDMTGETGTLGYMAPEKNYQCF